MVAAGPARSAELVRDFLNTLDLDTGYDELVSPATLAAWLREHGLATVRSATDADLRAAVTLREGLRAALGVCHASAGGPTAAGFDGLLADYPLRLSLQTGTPELEPTGSGAHGGLGKVVAAVAASQADGSWPRLKVCAENTCRWAFLDTSRNQSRSWCSMSVCGNRAKTKAYRSRQRQPAAASPEV